MVPIRSCCRLMVLLFFSCLDTIVTNVVVVTSVAIIIDRVKVIEVSVSATMYEALPDSAVRVASSANSNRRHR